MTETEQLGPYELIELLGRGAFGEVHLARLRGGEGFTTLRAVKRLHARHVGEPGLVDRFRREARIGGLVSSSRVVKVLDFQVLDGDFVLAMEFVDGVTVGQLANRFARADEPVPLPVALEIASGALEGLDHIHALVDPEGEVTAPVHRDLKPSNVMITPAGEVKILDFGVAKTDGGQTTLSGQILGTARYMSPEQARGDDLDGRSDLFSLGVVLLEVITGAPFLEGLDPRVGLRRLADGGYVDELKRLDGNVPEDVAAFVRSLLAFDRLHRPPDAGVALAELLPLMHEHRAAFALRSLARTRPALFDRGADPEPDVGSTRAQQLTPTGVVPPTVIDLPPAETVIGIPQAPPAAARAPTPDPTPEPTASTRTTGVFSAESLGPIPLLVVLLLVAAAWLALQPPVLPAGDVVGPTERALPPPPSGSAEVPLRNLGVAKPPAVATTKAQPTSSAPAATTPTEGAVVEPAVVEEPTEGALVEGAIVEPPGSEEPDPFRHAPSRAARPEDPVGRAPRTRDTLAALAAPFGLSDRSALGDIPRSLGRAVPRAGADATSGHHALQSGRIVVELADSRVAGVVIKRPSGLDPAWADEEGLHLLGRTRAVIRAELGVPTEAAPYAMRYAADGASVRFTCAGPGDSSRCGTVDVTFPPR